MFHNLDQLRLQFERENLHEVNAKNCLEINPVQAVDANLVVTESSRIESENNSSENALSKSVNETQMQMQEGKVDIGKALDAELVVIESSGTKSDNQDTSSRSGNYSTHAVDADIRPVNDQEPFAEVDSNTTPDSTNMCNKGGEINQNDEKCQVTSEQSYQSLESGKFSLKKTVVQFQKDFSRMEAHCVNLELKYQNQALKFEQHGQILNETSNKANIKMEKDVLEIINIELEHSVAKLLAENEWLNKENEHLKQTVSLKICQQTRNYISSYIAKHAGTRLDSLV
ncbi:hypothetical protein Tco_0790647 [Tanacetum coccineum]